MRTTHHCVFVLFLYNKLSLLNFGGEEMDLNKLLTRLDGYDNFVFYFGYYNGEDYITYAPNISKAVEESVISILKSNVMYYKDKKLSPYNPVGVLDGDIESVNIDKYSIVSNLMNSLDEPTEEDLDPLKVDFFIYELQFGEDKYYFFRRHHKMKTLRKKGIIASLINNELNEIRENSFIGIDDKIDLIVFEADIIIFQHTAFERIFKIDEQFKTEANKVLSNEKFTEKIKNFDKLWEDVMENLSYIKRVSKLSDTTTSLLFLEKLDQTKSVIEKFNLDIRVEFDSKLNDEVIIYDNKTQLTNFINLMQDAYYQTLIGEEKGVNERG